MKDNIFWAILILLAASIWGSTWVFVKILHLSSTQLVAFRLWIPFIFTTIYLFFTKQNLWIKNKQPFSYSVWNAIRMLLYYIWFNFATVANALIWLYTWPLFATIIDFIKTKHISKINLLCTLLGFVWIIITCLDKNFGSSIYNILWFLAVMVSAIISAFQRFQQKEIMKYSNNIQMILYQSFVWAIIFWPILFFVKPLPNFFQINTATIYAILIWIIWFYLYFRWLRKISIGYMSILSYFEFISWVLFAYFFIKEIPWLYTITWWIFILTAIITITLSKIQR